MATSASSAAASASSSAASIRALILGGSGQVGSKVVSELLRLPVHQCEKVTVLSRRPLPDDGPLVAGSWRNDARVDVHVVADLDTVEAEIDGSFRGYNAGFMCQVRVRVPYLSA